LNLKHREKEKVSGTFIAIKKTAHRGFLLALRSFSEVVVEIFKNRWNEFYDDT
jgi:hypothetical protein